MGEVANFFLGKTPPRKETQYWENPVYPWVSIADLKSGKTIKKTKESVNTYAFDKIFKKRLIPAGTLLMSFKLTIGKTSILGIDAFHNEAIISIFPFIDPQHTITNFLLETLPILAQLGAHVSAIKGDTLNSESLSKLLIPLPPLAEQRRIVAKVQELFGYIDSLV